ncbi:MAG: hypothetical protein KAI81_03705, partial [Candidatus Marinimicrobia bacterium]|nr:hypothetical protein [Candidatus Neomarinimicrobiota bacterium]
AQLEETILRQVPGCKISVDQPYREADLAIEFCEDVPMLPMAEVEKIVSIFEEAGAVANVLQFKEEQEHKPAWGHRGKRGVWFCRDGGYSSGCLT